MRIDEFTSVERIDKEIIYNDLGIMKDGVLYLTNNDTELFFNCPCGQHHPPDYKVGDRYMHWGHNHIYVNLPGSWTMVNENGLITISPSIYYPESCMAHFFIRQNKVIWC